MNASSNGHGRPADPFLQEITEQPDTLRASTRAVQAQAAVLEVFADRVRNADQPLVLTGMGSSLDAAEAAASVLARNGQPVMAVNTAELVHFRLASLRPGTCVVGVSQSGRSAEMVRLAEQMSGRTDLWLGAVANGTDNPLAHLAAATLDMAAGNEVGPATKTFAATLVALQAITYVLTGDPQVDELCAVLSDHAAQAAQSAAALLDDPAARADLTAQHIGDFDHLVLLGRGVARACADVGALVLKEASRTAAESMDAADFRHGPLELAGPELSAIVVTLEPATAALDRRLLDDLRARGSQVLAIGRPDESSGGPRQVIDSITPLLDVALAAIPLQLLAWRRSSANSTTPGRFLVGSKVTEQE